MSDKINKISSLLNSLEEENSFEGPLYCLWGVVLNLNHDSQAFQWNYDSIYYYSSSLFIPFFFIFSSVPPYFLLLPPLSSYTIFPFQLHMQSQLDYPCNPFKLKPASFLVTSHLFCFCEAAQVLMLHFWANHPTL